jgi:hypothetical protein
MAALFALGLPNSVRAQFSGQASATGTYESNTNVFALNSGFFLAGDPNFKRSDTDYSYGAELDGSYLLGRQEFYGTATMQQFDYQRYTQLDHTGYNFDAGWLWKFTNAVTGTLDAARTHSMVPFYNLTGISTLSLVTLTEQRESAQINIKLNPTWALKGSAFTSKAGQPTPDAPNLQLVQKSGTAGLDYLGFGDIAAGVTASYSSGDYSGTNGATVVLDPSFSQTSAGFTANYKHARTSFDGTLGYSRRTSGAGNDNSSGITGSLAFTDRLTPKTSFTVKVDRSINSYFLDAGSEIDTTAGATVDWQATYKLGVSAGYTFAYRKFPHQGNNPVGSDRIDIQESPVAALVFKPLKWLVIRPYANLQTRRSTFVGGHFSQNIYGVQLTATTPERRHAR